MHVNKQQKEGKEMIQKSSKVPGISNSKETQRHMEENKIYKLIMTPIFIIFINRITSLQENTMEMQKCEFSPQEH